MDPDDYQQAWQAHSSQTRVTIDAESLLKEVQRCQRKFRSEVIWNDCVGVGLALLLLPVWIYLGIRLSLPWTWFLAVPVLVWYAAFTLIYRLRHKQKLSEPGEPLLQCVQSSLNQVDRQIWFMRKIFWWSMLPSYISTLVITAHFGWLRSPEDWSMTLVLMGLIMVLTVATYYVCQLAVRWKIEPRRQELLALLRSLGDEGNSKG